MTDYTPPKTAQELLDRHKAGERYFPDVSLDGARLDGARLDGARLDGASLDGARLDGARLDGALLVGASLVGARLDGARLDGARLVGASLDGARLDGAKGLEKAWIISLPTSPWGTTISPTTMAIGCQAHTHAEWREFSDDRIARMAPREALPFWQTWKPHLMALCDVAAAWLAIVQPAVEAEVEVEVAPVEVVGL